MNVYSSMLCNIRANINSHSIRAVLRLQFSVFISKKSCASMPSIANTVLYEKADNICLIGLNRPECRNAVNHATAKSLVSAFERFENDDDLHAAVIYGRGGHFCAGYDLKEVSDLSKATAMRNYLNKSSDNRLMGPTMMRFKKPIIAAVTGYCVAGGLELASMCDIRVADDTAVFGVFCRRFGVPLIDGGTVRLPQLIGLSRAMHMIITGHAIDAKTALEYGLVTNLVETGTALGQAIRLARGIVRLPRQCMLADRASVYYSTYNASSFKDAMKYELDNSWPVIAEESVVGATKFAQGIGRGGKFDAELNVDANAKL